MRLRTASLLIAILSAACGGRASGAPAWPKTADKEVDGGESLEPRVAGTVAAADDDDDAVVEVKEVEKPAEKPATTEVTPVVTAPTVPTPEEPIQTEEIVIEIED
ncbi:MAG: hypothetical protein WKG01_04895 [Kofleriaceae bacterium]